MNNEASSSTAAYPPTSPLPSDDHALPLSETASTAAELAERRKKNRHTFNRKRGDLLDDLLRNIDILVYAELSLIYYMDCSYARFLLRAFIQFVFLTPKPAILPEPTQDRPVIGALAISSAICLFCHLYFDAPSAGESTRGYLHGGLAMDFIGQKGPSSRLQLVLLDLLVIVLQLIHLAASATRKRLKDSLERSGSGTASQSTGPLADNLTQDLDSEERGVRRVDEQQDIEMQTLNPPEGATVATDSSPSVEREALLASPTPPRTDAFIFDAFHSGQIVLADLNVWKCVKEQFQMAKDPRNAPATSIQSFRAELAARMLRMRLGTDAIRQTL